MIDLRGIDYLAWAGFGAIAAVACVSPVLAGLALWFPALWPWVLAPAAGGALVGLIICGLMQ